MNHLPNNVSDNEAMWIECLIDDELTSGQNRQLVCYLDKNPDGWKKVAIALMDERLLKAEICNAIDTEQAVMKIPTLARPYGFAQRRWSWATALVATLAMMLGAGIYHVANLSSRSAVEPSHAIADAVSAELGSDFPRDQMTTPVSFLEAYQPNSLVEVENTPTRAVYYIENQVPDFLIRAMVIAGHELKVGQKMVNVSGPNGQTIEVPINILEVEKYAAKL